MISWIDLSMWWNWLMSKCHPPAPAVAVPAVIETVALERELETDASVTKALFRLQQMHLGISTVRPDREASYLFEMNKNKYLLAATGIPLEDLETLEGIEKHLSAIANGDHG